MFITFVILDWSLICAIDIDVTDIPALSSRENISLELIHKSEEPLVTSFHARLARKQSSLSIFGTLLESLRVNELGVRLSLSHCPQFFPKTFAMSSRKNARSFSTFCNVFLRDALISGISSESYGATYLYLARLSSVSLMRSFLELSLIVVGSYL